MKKYVDNSTLLSLDEKLKAQYNATEDLTPLTDDELANLLSTKYDTYTLAEGTEAINCTHTVEGLNSTDRTCPYCGESYYMVNYSTCTAMYFPPIYKNGVNINPDRNKTTHHCTCMNCHKDFSF